MPKLKDFQAAANAWLEIDSRLSSDQNAAQSSGQQRKTQKLAALRVQNDRAYFLLIFARFEQYMNDVVTQFIIRRQSSAKWDSRRGWDVVQIANLSRVPFRNRLAYVLDKATADYNSVIQYYSIRNSLAHAGTTQVAFAIPSVESQLGSVSVNDAIRCEVDDRHDEDSPGR